MVYHRDEKKKQPIWRLWFFIWFLRNRLLPINVESVFKTHCSLSRMCHKQMKKLTLFIIGNPWTSQKQNNSKTREKKWYRRIQVLPILFLFSFYDSNTITLDDVKSFIRTFFFSSLIIFFYLIFNSKIYYLISCGKTYFQFFLIV